MLEHLKELQATQKRTPKDLMACQVVVLLDRLTGVEVIMALQQRTTLLVGAGYQ
jgi:hypothetical protein